MDIKRTGFAGRMAFLLLVALCWLRPGVAAAQALTGTLIGTVRDAQGQVVPGAHVRVTSPALIGGARTVTTTDKGQWRFQVLPPGTYALEIDLAGFVRHQEEGIRIGAGATIDHPVDLRIAGIAESIQVDGRASRLDPRDPGFSTRFGEEDLKSIPSRPMSMYGVIRAAPGISPTSPTSGTATTVSAFGSGTNENQFQLDGGNNTCPCNGVARSEPGISFIQEVQIQSVGASAEYGNFQGAVFNVITRQGGERFLFDGGYSAQTAGLTSQPVRLSNATASLESGYERATYRDLTANLGGPIVRERLWFFGGYQYLRDHDSQPGADPEHPRTFEQDKVFGKLTWRLTPALQLLQSFHGEDGLNPERPTIVTPYEAIALSHISVPAMTFGHLTHTLSSNTVWDARVGASCTHRKTAPMAGTRPSRAGSIGSLGSRVAPRPSSTSRSSAPRPRPPSATTAPGGWAEIISGSSVDNSRRGSTTREIRYSHRREICRPGRRSVGTHHDPGGPHRRASRSTPRPLPVTPSRSETG